MLVEREYLKTSASSLSLQLKLKNTTGVFRPPRPQQLILRPQRLALTLRPQRQRLALALRPQRQRLALALRPQRQRLALALRPQRQRLHSPSDLSDSGWHSPSDLSDSGWHSPSDFSYCSLPASTVISATKRTNASAHSSLLRSNTSSLFLSHRFT